MTSRTGRLPTARRQAQDLFTRWKYNRELWAIESEGPTAMPTHFKFSFGVGSYFKFSFSLGQSRDRTPHADGGLASQRELDKVLARRNGVQFDDPKKPVQPKDQSQCPLFTIAPPEIRQMIYRLLLVTPATIEQPHRYLGSRETIMLDQTARYSNLDAAVLRTCRLIYSEALQILYGQNAFRFTCPQHIKSFQSKNLSTMPTAFNLKLSHQGRLTMLRDVTLCLTSEFLHRSHHAQDRDRLWREWTMNVFCDDKDPHFCYSYREYLSFPSLERLKLDFSDWQLSDNEGLVVKPFVRKLGEHGKLQKLVLKGVKHQPTIERFREGLVKEGGSLEVED